MFEELFDEATVAYHKNDEQKMETIISQLVAAGQKAVPAVAEALRGDKLRGHIAVQALRLIGYPQNESAIPQLVFLIEDSNHPAWEEGIRVLVAMDADVVIPHIMAALLKPGIPYHTDESEEMWANDVENICTMLIQPSVPKEYVLRCCPAIDYLLNQRVFSSNPDPELLLEVVRKAGNQVDYLIPTLIKISQQFSTVYIGEQARECLSLFTRSQLSPYSLLM